MLALTLVADMTGVTNLRPDDTDEEPFIYMLEVQCISCRETHDKMVGVNRIEMREISGSKGKSNFVWRCKHCKHEHSAMIRAPPKPYLLTSPPKQQTILEFECRGCEFTGFSPDGDWLVDGVESGTKFEDIDLTDGEWFEYDEKAGKEVTIKDLKWEIKRA